MHGDPDALDRAVANLVDNALKFTPTARSDTRTGVAAPPPVLVTVRLHDTSATVEVRDHGPGIPAADLPYVFDRFHRSPTARSLPGSGLGLAIVKQIAEAHGGGVEAVPMSEGALVRITLPAAAPR
ncbi:sensor histidine kinase [Kitasatospora sp. P5_F3]